MTTYQCPGCGGAIVGAEVCPDCRMRFPANVETVEDAMTTDNLRALLAKATPGPFYWFMRECATKDALMLELSAVVDKTAAVNGYNLHGVAVGDQDPDADYLAVAHTGCGPRSPINAQLIVAAVNALPGLLDRLEVDALDAARYRWLRKQFFGVDFRFFDDGRGVLNFVFPEGASIGIYLDAAIDAAREPK